MTLNEFDYRVETLHDFVEFCDDYGFSDCDGWIPEDEYDSYVCDDIRDVIERRCWSDVRDLLDELPDGYNYYIHNGMLDFTAVYEDDAGEYIANLRDRLLDDGWFDEEDDEDEDEDYDDSDDESDEWNRVDAAPQTEVSKIQNDIQILF